MEKLDSESAKMLNQIVECFGIEPVLVELADIFVRLAEEQTKQFKLEAAKQSAMVAADLDRARQMMAMVHGWRVGC